MPQRPNVIVVFTEGLSEHILHDERNIMPNARALEEKSISFANYYNHTFATYMGLNGQLYSGYQRLLYDKNLLPSLQEILGQDGYHTEFFNTEPKNQEFTRYLENMQFDSVITDTSHLTGLLDSVSDGNAYDNLFERALALDKSEEPFLLCIYTFGTHASFDSVEEQFLDGSNALLNKFYNADVQLGKFLARFEQSSLYENTLLVFTADHCTYADSDFRQAFPEYVRQSEMCDRIPLMFYFKGCAPMRHDAGGRNSLDMVPTLLDVIDVSAPNFFLGASLFGTAAEHSHHFQSLATYYVTSSDSISLIRGAAAKSFKSFLTEYFSACLIDYDAD